MRILVISHMYPNRMNEVYGNFVEKQIHELIQRGHEVKVISPVPWSGNLLANFSDKWRGYADLPKEEYRNGVEVLYPPYPVLPRKILYHTLGRSCYHSIKRTVDSLSCRFDFQIIHAHTAIPDGSAALFLKKKWGRPVVMTIHGQDIFVNMHMSYLNRQAVLRTLRETDQVVAVSGKLAKEMAPFVPEGQLKVIPNGILLHELVSGDAPVFPEFAGRRILLSVGYLIPRKGHRYVLEALKELVSDFPDLLYLVIGDGAEEVSLKKMVADLSLEPWVRFLGRLPGRQVMEFMAQSEIFILPSWDEAFGVVYLEAMAHGRPVIGCRGEGIEDFVIDGENGFLVPAHNSQALTEVIRRLLENRELAREAGRRGKDTVLSRYTWARVAEELEQLYLELIGF